MRLNLDRQSKSPFRPLRTPPRGQVLWHLCVFIGLLLALAVTSPVRAQNKPPPGSSRFLFIVDTSAAMQRHESDILKLVSDLITSGASGQIHPGDTIGLWTFDQDVHSDLPVQSWTGGDQSEIALRTVNFLKQQFTNAPSRSTSSEPLQRGGQSPRISSSEKPARFSSVLPYMFEIIEASDNITTFIISTGDGKIKGTPFDADINDRQRQSIKDMNGKRMPVVTILQARAGKVLRYTVNALPWPIVMPEPMLVLNAPAKPSPAVIPNKSTPTDQIATPITNTPAVPPPQHVVTNVAIVQNPAPPAPVVPAPVANVTPVPPPPAKAEPPKTNSPPLIVESASTRPHETNLLPVAPDLGPRKKIEIASLEISDSATHHAYSPVTNSPSAPAQPVVPSPTTPPTVIATNPVAVPQHKPVVPAPANPPPTLFDNPLPHPALAAVSSEPPARPKFLLLAAAGLILIAFILIAMIVRRYRDNSGPSLITRSMGNRKK